MNRTSNLEIIAELHPQHGGDFGVIREMIRQARVGGADVAKFQLYDAGRLLGDQWNYLELKLDDVARIKAWCDEEGIEFMASVFDAERVAWCEELGIRRYKIASRTASADAELCRTILSKGKPTIISLGMWEGEGLPFGTSDQVEYLYCVSKYPAHWSDLTGLPADFEAAGLHGYSDHTLGLDVSLLAIARGARIIEKHFTLNKAGGKTTERAHVCSMTMDELEQLRRIGGSLLRARTAIARYARKEAGPLPGVPRPSKST